MVCSAEQTIFLLDVMCVVEGFYMCRIGAAALEMGAAAVILLPVLLVINAVYWHDLRKTAGYFVFACCRGGRTTRCVSFGCWRVWCWP